MNGNAMTRRLVLNYDGTLTASRNAGGRPIAAQIIETGAVSYRLVHAGRARST
jgi:hypothetical protein